MDTVLETMGDLLREMFKLFTEKDEEKKVYVTLHYMPVFTQIIGKDIFVKKSNIVFFCFWSNQM